MNPIFTDLEGEFGTSWKLLSRNQNGVEMYAMPMQGVGVCVRTIENGRILSSEIVKNSVLVEVMREDNGPGLVDADEQEVGEKRFICVFREVMGFEYARRSFKDEMMKDVPVRERKGKLGQKIYSGATITQVQVVQRLVQKVPAGAIPEGAAK